MSLIKWFLFLSSVLPLVATAANQYQHEAEELKSNLIFETEKYQNSVSQMAEEWSSPEFKQQQMIARKKIQELLAPEADDGSEIKDTVASQDRIVVFISSSIPMNTLRAMAADLARIEGVMVMRGGIQGLQEIVPTLKFISDILRVDPSCTERCKMLSTDVLIDPMLFRENGVERVPAVAFIEDLSVNTYCERKGESPTAERITYGDASIYGHIKEQAREINSSSLSSFMKALEG